MNWSGAVPWKIKLTETADKQMAGLGRQEEKRIRKFLRERVEPCGNPRDFGDPLVGNFSGLWRYRVGKYRLICNIQDEEIIILVLRIGHRREVYK
jgi:mRNA interferase RelE/StbE